MEQHSILLYEPDPAVEFLLTQLLQNRRQAVRQVQSVSKLMERLESESLEQEHSEVVRGKAGILIMGEPQPFGEDRRELLSLPKRFEHWDMVLLSSSSWTSEAGELAAFSALLAKPFLFEELWEVVQRLRNRRMGAEAATFSSVFS